VNIGRIRYRLAERLSQLTGAVFEAHNLLRNNPIHVHYMDCCSWDAWGTKADGVKVHVYSWDTMRSCIRGKVTLLAHSHQADNNSFEVCSSIDPE